MFVSGHLQMGDEIPKEMRLCQQCEARVRLKKGVYVMQSLMKGKTFPNTTDINMEIDKGVSKIKFCYPMFACEEIHKACEESDKSPV